MHAIGDLDRNFCAGIIELDADGMPDEHARFVVCNERESISAGGRHQVGGDGHVGRSGKEAKSPRLQAQS